MTLGHEGGWSLPKGGRQEDRLLGTRALEWVRENWVPLLASAVGAPMIVVWLEPMGVLSPYYFSSLLQGFAALLGIGVAGVLVAVQLASHYYGQSFAYRQLVAARHLGICLTLYVSVLGLCALALGTEALLRMVPVLTTATGTAVLALSAFAMKASWDLLRHMFYASTPGGAISWIGRCLLEGDLDSASDLVGVLDSASRDRGSWDDAWRSCRVLLSTCLAYPGKSSASGLLLLAACLAQHSLDKAHAEHREDMVNDLWKLAERALSSGRGGAANVLAWLLDLTTEAPEGLVDRLQGSASNAAGVPSGPQMLLEVLEQERARTAAVWSLLAPRLFAAPAGARQGLTPPASLAGKVGSRETSERRLDAIKRRYAVDDQLEIVLRQSWHTEDYDEMLRVGRNMSRPLYLSGNHRLRLMMGQLLQSLAERGDRQEFQYSLLIDDVGWSSVLDEDVVLGLENVARGTLMAEECGDPYFQARGYRHVAGVLMKRGHAQDALIMLRKAEDLAATIATEDPKREMLGGIWYGRGTALAQMGMTFEALMSCLHARQYYEKIRDTSREARTHALEGELAEAVELPGRAIVAFREGLARARTSSRREEIARSCEGIARAAYKLGKHYRARKYAGIADRMRKTIHLS